MESKDVYTAELRICGTNETELKDLQAILPSLVAEALNPVNTERTRMRVSMEGVCIEIDLSTDTLSHLRALTNSTLYLFNAALNTLRLVRSLTYDR